MFVRSGWVVVVAIALCAFLKVLIQTLESIPSRNFSVEKLGYAEIKRSDWMFHVTRLF